MTKGTLHAHCKTFVQTAAAHAEQSDVPAGLALLSASETEAKCHMDNKPPLNLYTRLKVPALAQLA